MSGDLYFQTDKMIIGTQAAHIKKLEQKLADYDLNNRELYSACQRAVKDISLANQKIEIMREALLYYGNPEHWTGNGWDSEEQGFYWESTLTVAENQDYENLDGTVMTCGKRARQALAKVEAMDKEEK